MKEHVKVVANSARSVPRILIFSHISDRDGAALLRLIAQTLKERNVSIQHLILSTYDETPHGTPPGSAHITPFGILFRLIPLQTDVLNIPRRISFQSFGMTTSKFGRASTEKATQLSIPASRELSTLPKRLVTKMVECKLLSQEVST